MDRPLRGIPGSHLDPKHDPRWRAGYEAGDRAARDVLETEYTHHLVAVLLLLSGKAEIPETLLTHLPDGIRVIRRYDGERKVLTFHLEDADGQPWPPPVVI